MGTGIVNFVFAIPAVYTIDTFGRRNLLLTTFPLMSLFLTFGALSFLIPNSEGVINVRGTSPDSDAAEPSRAQLGCIATAIYLFMVVYSPGEGPVPFTYSAEAFPLYIRDIGMSFATAVCWGFNFILSLTWPALSEAFTPLGAFMWYAAWNIFGWVYCYFLLPEVSSPIYMFKETHLTPHRPRISLSKNWTLCSTSATRSTLRTTRRRLRGTCRNLCARMCRRSSHSASCTRRALPMPRATRRQSSLALR